MNIKPPEPFTFEKGDRAILLLHGFTGNSADVRMLGRYLESEGYTSHAPIYKGHGLVSPEELIQTTPKDWWDSVMDGYHLLKEKGYKKIAAAGISLGGVLSLQLAMAVPLVGVVSMCAPMGFRNEQVLDRMVQQYAHNYAKATGTEPIDVPTTNIPATEGLVELVEKVRLNLSKITVPTFIVQGRNDEVIDLDSPDIIHDGIQSQTKEIKWYEQSGHIITLDTERDLVEEDIAAFFDTLEWSTSFTPPELDVEDIQQIWW